MNVKGIFATLNACLWFSTMSFLFRSTSSSRRFSFSTCWHCWHKKDCVNPTCPNHVKWFITANFMNFTNWNSEIKWNQWNCWHFFNVSESPAFRPCGWLQLWETHLSDGVVTTKPWTGSWTGCKWQWPSSTENHCAISFLIFSGVQVSNSIHLCSNRQKLQMLKQCWPFSVQRWLGSMHASSPG